MRALYARDHRTLSEVGLHAPSSLLIAAVACLYSHADAQIANERLFYYTDTEDSYASLSSMRHSTSRRLNGCWPIPWRVVGPCERW